MGSFSIDLFAEMDNGDKVIIENQLEKTDHNHLGQIIITYFTNLNEKVKTVIWIAKDVRAEHENAVNWFNKYTELRFFLIQLCIYTSFFFPLNCCNSFFLRRTHNSGVLALFRLPPDEREKVP